MEQKLVLLVEDDHDVRDAVSELLREAGYLVETATNGQEALERLDEVRPCLVLLDLRMPRYSGEYFLNNLDRKKSDAPVIVLTASNESPEGVNGVLKKPISLESLIETVEHHCS